MHETNEINLIIEEIDEFLAPLIGITPQQAAFNRLKAQKLKEENEND